MIAAYRHPDRAKGRKLMVKLIDSISHGVPAARFFNVLPRVTISTSAAVVVVHELNAAVSGRGDPMRASGPLDRVVGRLLQRLRELHGNPVRPKGSENLPSALTGLEIRTLNVPHPPITQGAAGIGTLLGMSLAKHQVHSKRRRCARRRSVCVQPGKYRRRDVPERVLFEAQLAQECSQVFRGNQVALPWLTRPGNGKIERLSVARTDVLEHELTAGSQDARYFTVELALFGNVHLRLNRPHAIERAIIKR